VSVITPLEQIYPFNSSVLRRSPDAVMNAAPAPAETPLERILSEETPGGEMSTPLERILRDDSEPMTCGNGTYTFSATSPG
jgi:hypothetical protein